MSSGEEQAGLQPPSVQDTRTYTQSTSSASLLSTLMPVTSFGGDGGTGVCVFLRMCECACVLGEKASNQNERSLFSFLTRRPDDLFFFFLLLLLCPNLHR